ncbi:MAG: glycosyltransferase family 1 protein [bacterium]|nr:glycosyltransferase family 1 protein [bacterium]
MKIFYDGYIYTYKKYGGINRIFTELADSLGGPGKGNQIYRFRFSDNKTAVSCFYQVPKLGGLMRRYDNMILAGRIRKFRPDIYHTSYYRLPVEIPGKKIVTVYDLIHEKYPQYFSKPEVFLNQKKASIEAADMLLAISETTRRDLIEYYRLAPEKVTVIYLAASHVFSRVTAEEKQLFQQANNLTKPFLLYVGQRKGYKNYLTLLQVYSKWSSNREVDLISVGGEAGLSPEEAKIIRDCNLKGSVRMLAGMGDQQLRLYYGTALAFVYPSYYEGFGLPVLEAMACGTPVLLAKSPSLEEVAAKAGLYFTPLSAQELHSKLEELVNSENLRNQLSLQGLMRSQEFNWEKTCADTYNAYLRALGG